MTSLASCLIIAAPSSINVSTLERYIPPITGEEVGEFFADPTWWID
jgi:hypothetical protein